jgi:hypothetical protein
VCAAACSPSTHHVFIILPTPAKGVRQLPIHYSISVILFDLFNTLLQFLCNSYGVYFSFMCATKMALVLNKDELPLVLLWSSLATPNKSNVTFYFFVLILQPGS